MVASPLLPVASGLIIGIAMDQSWFFPRWVYAGLFIVATLLILWFRSRLILAPVLLLMAAMSVGGVLHLAAARTIPATSVELFVGEGKRIARLRGTVASPPRVMEPPEYPFARWSYGGERTTFLLDVESIEGLEGDIRVTGRLRASIGGAVLDLRENEQIEVFGWLSPLRPPANPGSFDWSTYYRREGVCATLSCDHRESVHRLGERAENAWGRVVTWLRTTVRGMLTDDLLTGADEQSGLLEAMVLGHRSILDRRLNEAFIRSGCAHFLAVSGSNVAMLMAFVWVAGRLVGLTKRRCAWVMILVIVTYALITDPRPPIFRATIMGLLFCISLILQRSPSHLNWMSAAAIILVVINPTTVFDAGFQLSFLAVLGVTHLAPVMQEIAVETLFKRMRMVLFQTLRPEPSGNVQLLLPLPSSSRYWRWLGIMVWASVGAWLAGIPISLCFFQRLNSWGWLGTILLFPLMQAVMVLGLLKVVITAISPTLGSFLAMPLAALESAITWSVTFLERFPGSTIDCKPLPGWLLFSFYLALVLIVHLCRQKPPSTLQQSGFIQPVGVEKSFATVTCVVAMLVSLAGGMYWYWPKSPPNQLMMTVLAVGAGSATVIELPDGQTILYDAGSKGRYDAGRNIVVPYLRSHGTRRIDRIYVSHPDVDHFGGIPSIVDEIRTGPIVFNQFFEARSAPTSASKHLLDLLAERGHEVVTLPPSLTRWQHGGATIERLWPDDNLGDTIADNDTSTVLRVSFAGHSVLLTGDIEDHAQRVLLRRGDLNADVLLLPHHGSVRPSTREFLAAVGADHLIRSSHEKTDETVNGLPDLVGGTAIYNTADVGAVQVVLDADGVHVTTYSGKGLVPS